MAEQGIYGSHLGGKEAPLDRLTDKLRRGARPGSGSGAEQDVYGTHFRPGAGTTTTLGLLQSAVLPSFGLHAGLSAVAYGVSRYTDRVEGKDWLWPSGMTANAWWSAIGSRVVYDGLSLGDAWSTLNYPQKLLLSGVSAWGLRLFYRIVTRSVKRGQDDPRYTETKKEPGFWNRALFTMFLPEAVAQTLISLPFTLPFRAPVQSAIESPALFHSLAVFLFCTGFALETVADAQLETHKKTQPPTVLRDGVWSIVRHPNYLGDALIHASFPILLVGAGLLHPLALAGPVANYVFLRVVGGDKQNEESQQERYSKADPVKAIEFKEYQQQKNSFWPGIGELGNPWTWIVAAAGVGGILVERSARHIF